MLDLAVDKSFVYHLKIRPDDYLSLLFKPFPLDHWVVQLCVCITNLLLAHKQFKSLSQPWFRPMPTSFNFTLVQIINNKIYSERNFNEKEPLDSPVYQSAYHLAKGLITCGWSMMYVGFIHSDSIYSPTNCK